MLFRSVIGGGINGAGIARDAAGRGLSTLLVERGDLASATSSSSSKLLHGGLRYLEQYEFRLVAEALAEREILLRVAGHLAWPLRFVIPHVPELRPRWMIRVGLFLYDHLARRSVLPGSQAVVLFDQSTFIKESLDGLIREGLLGDAFGLEEFLSKYRASVHGRSRAPHRLDLTLAHHLFN